MDIKERNIRNINTMDCSNERWLQVDYTNRLSRKHFYRFIDDMREDYERIHDDKFAYKELVSRNSPCTTITIMHDGYFPKDILIFHAEEYLGIRSVPKGRRAIYKELDKCPFCGSSNVELMASDIPGEFKVICNGCMIAVEPIFMFKEDIPDDMDMRETTINRWNRRP